MKGPAIIRLNLIGTIVFVGSALIATIVFDGVAKTQGVVVSLALFGSGVVFFLWGYWRAVQRSRHDSMSVTELYFLVGPHVDRRVSRVMNALLGIQVIVAVATALARSSTPASDGSQTPGSTLAFGVLVPVFGLSLNGVWASAHGRFPPRAVSHPTR
ncbi:MAG: hypothetical protein RLZ37_1028 [Actinomycetota bacterium]